MDWITMGTKTRQIMACHGNVCNRVDTAESQHDVAKTRGHPHDSGMLCGMSGKEARMSAQHFLVPVDFSPCSDETLAYAIMLATQLQARLTLLHVLPELALGVGPPPPAALPALVTYLHDLEAKVQQELDAHLTQVQEAGLQGDTVLVHGVPSQGILDTARDQHVDLIIMGTHGRTRAHQMLIGSVAQQVVPRASCPILLLPTHADEIMMY
jgi:nucleotide-binding universal stress UspA family protein